MLQVAPALVVGVDAKALEVLRGGVAVAAGGRGAQRRQTPRLPPRCAPLARVPVVAVPRRPALAASDEVGVAAEGAIVGAHRRDNQDEGAQVLIGHQPPVVASSMTSPGRSS